MPIFFAQTFARVYFLALYHDTKKIKTNFFISKKTANFAQSVITNRILVILMIDARNH